MSGRKKSKKKNYKPTISGTGHTTTGSTHSKPSNQTTKSNSETILSNKELTKSRDSNTSNFTQNSKNLLQKPIDIYTVESLSVTTQDRNSLVLSVNTDNASILTLQSGKVQGQKLEKIKSKNKQHTQLQNSSLSTSLSNNLPTPQNTCHNNSNTITLPIKSNSQSKILSNLKSSSNQTSESNSEENMNQLANSPINLPSNKPLTDSPLLQDLNLNHTKNTCSNLAISVNCSPEKNSTTQKTKPSKNQSSNSNDTPSEFLNTSHIVDGCGDHQDSQKISNSHYKNPAQSATSLEDINLIGLSGDGNFYKNLITRITEQIQNNIKFCEDKLNQNESIVFLSDDIIGLMNSYTGAGNLLIKSKFKQFIGLCDLNLEAQWETIKLDADHPSQRLDKNGDPLPTNIDISGFFEMISIQINQMKNKFAIIKLWEKNNWSEPDTQLIKNVNLSNSFTTQGSSHLDNNGKTLSSYSTPNIIAKALNSSHTRPSSAQSSKSINQENNSSNSSSSKKAMKSKQASSNLREQIKAARKAKMLEMKKLKAAEMAENDSKNDSINENN